MVQKTLAKSEKKKRSEPEHKDLKFQTSYRHSEDGFDILLVLLLERFVSFRVVRTKQSVHPAEARPDANALVGARFGLREELRGGLRTVAKQFEATALECDAVLDLR